MTVGEAVQFDEDGFALEPGPLPETLDEAHRWIRRLQDGYKREAKYAKQLERRLRRREDVIWRALAWRKARGMHIKPALEWLKRVTAQLDETLAREEPETPRP